MNGSKNKFMELAIALSEKSVAEGGGPFGAVVVRRGEVVATGTNSVTLLNDPTAHAEVSAIRAACAAVKDFKLEECEIYSSCEPCPMCLSAIYWAGIRKIYFANTREDAKRIGFDDSFIYAQIPLAPSRRTVPSEEMLRAEDMGEYFRVACDSRDLNYDRFTVGSVRTQADESYTSHNTRRLDVTETVEKIKTAEYVQLALEGRESEAIQ